MKLAPELIEYIKTNGPLTVADYMARCNTHYYATRDPFGTGGDFITAPEVSQIFGELIGAWLADSWAQAGNKRSLLCEAGPGRGTLMKDVLRATRGVSGFHEALDLRLIETSPTLREIQAVTLKGMHPRIEWQETLANLPPLPLLFIANEFFDALPFQQFVKVGLEETERKVGYDGREFTWIPEGAVVREASPVSHSIMTNIATHIHKHGGAALIIDYGYTHGEQGDTLQAMQQHRHVDPLRQQGEVDLTAHVDFAALAQAARNGGAQVYGPAPQGTFLKRLGAELRATALCKSASAEQQKALLSGLERLVAPHEMGTLFKVLAVTSSLDRPAGF